MNKTYFMNLNEKPFALIKSGDKVIEMRLFKGERKEIQSGEAERLKAVLEDEVPIGAVIVYDDKVIARAHNKRDGKNLTYAHAEMLAIEKANKKLGSWRMPECDLYVTLEPCIMCMGAIIQSRIKNIYYGAKDPKGGAVNSSIKFDEIKNLNHYPEIISGVLEKECSQVIKEYFANKRKRN